MMADTRLVTTRARPLTAAQLIVSPLVFRCLIKGNVWWLNPGEMSPDAVPDP
jgi:hypothetical protein